MQESIAEKLLGEKADELNKKPWKYRPQQK